MIMKKFFAVKNHIPLFVLLLVQGVVRCDDFLVYDVQRISHFFASGQEDRYKNNNFFNATETFLKI